MRCFTVAVFVVAIVDVVDLLVVEGGDGRERVSENKVKRRETVPLGKKHFD